MTELTAPELLLPTADLYPFDGLCAHLVRELASGCATSPNLTVEWDTYGKQERRFKYLKSVRTPEMKLTFHRHQGRIEGTPINDIAAVGKLLIRGYGELSVSHDASIIALDRYVGTPLSSEGLDAFENEPRVNEKLYGKPRTTLHYIGTCACTEVERPHLWHRHPQRMADKLVPRKDERDYAPGDDDPKEYLTAEVLALFADAVRTKVGLYLQR